LLLFVKSRETSVNHNNVNSDWTGSVAPSQPIPIAAAA
jgi:hypothetical protein